jgi:hypothetical protein
MLKDPFSIHHKRSQERVLMQVFLRHDVKVPQIDHELGWRNRETRRRRRSPDWITFASRRRSISTRPTPQEQWRATPPPSAPWWLRRHKRRAPTHLPGETSKVLWRTSFISPRCMVSRQREQSDHQSSSHKPDGYPPPKPADILPRPDHLWKPESTDLLLFFAKPTDRNRGGPTCFFLKPPLIEHE